MSKVTVIYLIVRVVITNELLSTYLVEKYLVLVWRSPLELWHYSVFHFCHPQLPRYYIIQQGLILRHYNRKKKYFYSLFFHLFLLNSHFFSLVSITFRRPMRLWKIQKFLLPLSSCVCGHLRLLWKCYKKLTK